MLRLKAAKSFLETSQCTLRTQQCGSTEKIRTTRCENSKFYPELAKIRIKNPDKQKIFIKKNVRNNLHHQFYPVSAKIRSNRGLLYLHIVITAEGPTPGPHPEQSPEGLQ